MANTASNIQQRGIKQGWSLLAFVRDFGVPQYIEDFKDKEGRTFAALSFSSDKFNSEQIRDIQDKNGNIRKSNFVTVSFSQDCPATTFDEIIKQRDSLQVIELQRDSEHPYASFKLCAKGKFEPRGTTMSALLS